MPLTHSSAPRRLFFTTAALLMAATHAPAFAASTASFSFQGSVINGNPGSLPGFDGVSVGDVATLDFAFDLDQPGMLGLFPFTGLFDPNAIAFDSFSFMLGDTTLTNPTQSFISVRNDDDGDSFQATASFGGSSIDPNATSVVLTLIDSTGTAFNSDNLPDSLDFNQFDDIATEIAVAQPGGGFGINLTSITPGSGVTPTAPPAPEPTPAIDPTPDPIPAPAPSPEPTPETTPPIEPAPETTPPLAPAPQPAPTPTPEVGLTQDNPILPDSVTNDGTRFVFDAPVSDRFFDPPVADGFVFEIIGDGAFTEINTFPEGFGDQLLLTVDGQDIDIFGAGDGFVFDDEGVQAFEITGISPEVLATNTDAFPLRLSFVDGTQGFSQTAILASGSDGIPHTSIPSPAALPAGLALLSFMGLRRKRSA